MVSRGILTFEKYAILLRRDCSKGREVPSTLKLIYRESMKNLTAIELIMAILYRQ
jgi:hypothetical protein